MISQKSINGTVAHTNGTPASASDLHADFAVVERHLARIHQQIVQLIHSPEALDNTQLMRQALHCQCRIESLRLMKDDAELWVDRLFNTSPKQETD
jgi:hypothetical protein